MDHLVLQTIVFCASLYLGLLKNQGNNVFQLTDFNVSMNLSVQPQSLKLDFSNNSNYEKEMVFNIQIYQSEENNIVFNANYTFDQLLQWNWEPKIPLECATHGVRIRSMERHSELWGKWSSWKTVDGLDTLTEDIGYIFPKEKTVEEGSNVTFCCIAQKNGMVIEHRFNGHIEKTPEHRRVTFTTTSVGRSSNFGLNVRCSFTGGEGNFAGTLLYVTRKPVQPKNPECETEDLISLKCTWDPGNINSYNNIFNGCPAKFTLLYKNGSSNVEVNCKKDSQKIVCKFEIGKQTTFNLTLKTHNCLGDAKIDHFVDVTQRVRPAAPFDLSVSYHNATAIQLYWNINRIKEAVLCQISSSYPGGEEQENVTVYYRIDSQPNITLNHLQPYTNYCFKVRCGAITSLWKWSDWSQCRTLQTNESAPSGQLDIWRDIKADSEQFNVTVFWKTTSGFRANGKIQAYELFCQDLEEPAVPSRKTSVSPLKNSTTIPVEAHTYKIGVSMKNSVNTSQPSLMIVSTAGENGNLPEKEEDTKNNTEHGIFVSWKPQDQYNGYIVDWCNYPKSHTCDFQWKKLGSNESSTLIMSDAFSPGVRYTFRVYGRKGAEAYLLEKKTKYLKELEPKKALILQISEVTSSSFTVNWELNFLNESQPGFIRGYTVYVKTEHRNCTLEEFRQNPDNPEVCIYTLNNPRQNNFTVRGLEPNTTYMAAVEAYSVKPKSNPDNYKDVITQADRGNWMWYLLILGIVSLMLIICMCCWKCACLKDCMFPKIPEPAVSPFIKMNPPKMGINYVIPDELVVLDKHQCSVHKDDAMEPLMLENMTYMDPGSYQNLRLQETTNKECNPALTGYKPLEDFGFMDHPTSQPLKKAEYNFTYLSQTHLSLSKVQEGDLASSLALVQQTVYKPQLVPEHKPNGLDI